MPRKLTALQQSFLGKVEHGSARCYGAATTWFALQERGFVILTAHDPIHVYARITPEGAAELARLGLTTEHPGDRQDRLDREAVERAQG